ncbi:hypothetical protein J2S00_000264 [Caldalkalibacillus uzonensis]|uniref:VOC domain-containing protein n=1 Tax=Caldalkalibacillus uzonensis TaxID=353224 RepID=A0ABU0CM49_9BACI|nr:hypothetical protein [Caldalkalibacillus uzonensis]MDQ0337494.1 hypothetical protein [Caldalkalibacillus uzonensis]
MGSLSFWQERLQLHGIQVKRDERFGRAMLLFTDYDGIELALVETEQMVSLQDWAGQDVPHKHIIRHMFGVSIGVQSADPTVQVLQEGGLGL